MSTIYITYSYIESFYVEQAYGLWCPFDSWTNFVTKPANNKIF